MKIKVLSAISLLFIGSILAASAAPKDDVTAAAKKLNSSANYSWNATVTMPEGSRFRPGPSEGKTEKDGVTWFKMSFGPNTTEGVIKGDKAAAKSGDTGWQSEEELNNSEGPGRFLGMLLKNYRTPAEQAVEVVADVNELKKDGDVYAGDLTEDGAKKMLTFGGRRNTNTAGAKDAKGSARFWVKDGLLTKVEYKVSGKVTFNGNERDVERTTTIEFKDVGSTKITVPDEAKAKMEPAAKPPVEAKTNAPAMEKK